MRVALAQSEESRVTETKVSFIPTEANQIIFCLMSTRLSDIKGAGIVSWDKRFELANGDRVQSLIELYWTEDRVNSDWVSETCRFGGCSTSYEGERRPRKWKRGREKESHVGFRWSSLHPARNRNRSHADLFMADRLREKRESFVGEK